MLTIHVGLHKTGSTAIQDYLASGHKNAKQRFRYLGADSLLGSNGFRVPPRPADGRSRALSLLTNHQDVVISSEGFLGSGTHMYKNAQDCALAMRNYFAERTAFQVVLYLRPQLPWFSSYHAQLVQQGSTNPPDRWVMRALESRYARYSTLIQDLTQVLGAERLVVRAYTPETDAVSDFLGVIGLPIDPGVSVRPRRNPSINPAQVEIMRRINQSATNPLLQQQARWFFQNISVTGQNQNLSVFSEELQQRLIDLTKEDWKCLPSTIIGTRFADPSVFRKVAEEAANWTVRPDVGAKVNCEEVVQESMLALETAIPLVWLHNFQVETRVRRLVRRFRGKAATDSAGLLPSARHSVLQSVERLHPSRWYGSGQ